MKILFRSILRTEDFQKTLDDFIAESAALYPELRVSDVALVNVGGTGNIIKLVMTDDVSEVLHAKGYFIDQAALTAAHPTGEAGDWAIVGSTDTVWVWDTAGLGAWIDTGLGSIVDWGDIGGTLANQMDLASRFVEADETHYNGLLEAENFAITYDETTRIFTLTLAADQQISLSRVLYTIPAGVYTTVAHANASDVYYLLFNGTTFIASTSFDFGTQVVLAYVSYNATTGKGVLFDERHPADIDKGMPPMVHAWLHVNQGAVLESGGAVSGHTLNSNTKTDMQPVIEETKIVDESLKKTLAALAAGTYKTAYRSGTVASGEWTYVNSDTPIRYDGSNNPIHNDISGVNALSTAISANNRWLNVYVIATNAYDAAYQHLWIQPQTLHTSETAAFDEDFLTAINWGDKPVAEIVPLAKFTFRRQTGAMNFRITRVENIRGTKVSLATTTSVSIHNNLGGRSVPDVHPVSSISNAQNEILPIELFEDGATPPSELGITDGKRYRDFTVNDDVDLYTVKRVSYNNPSSSRLVMVISNATAPAIGETINFEISVNGGAAVTLSYVGLGTEAQNDVIVTDFESASFGTGNYTVSLERVAGTYAQEIGVMAVEVN